MEEFREDKAQLHPLFNMVQLKNAAEIELIRVSALLVSQALAELASILKPGITTLALNQRAEEFILDQKAVPSFKNYKC